MNKELQKILNQMEATLELWKTLKGVKDSYLEFREKDIKLLYDCITNLQQKYESAILIGKKLNKDNERANQYIDFYEDLTKQQINMINDYKSRNEKAMEYNKQIIKALLTCTSYEKDKVEDMLYEQQNILQGK